MQIWCISRSKNGSSVQMADDCREADAADAADDDDAQHDGAEQIRNSTNFVGVVAPLNCSIAPREMQVMRPLIAAHCKQANVMRWGLGQPE